ncbi:uncharacterized protein LOC112574881 [Pomacea canaliculata]|uniref:uncharacterized protein LOC112574881 n=1 Tax=Pomacea canaliculata TaxID=400727 RepID=UPI000D739469|nr:uncharacterized protein LOC112574881 [Pomacea canaliculata]
MTVPRRTRMNSLLLISAAVVVVWALVVSADQYKKCPDGLMYHYPVLTAVRGQSRLTCAVLCSTDIRCKAVNVCPDRLMPSRVMCDLLASQNPGRCESGLETATFPSCAYLHKELPSPEGATTTPGVKSVALNETCENGGVFNISMNRCACPVEFAGNKCERRIRDCSDAMENGGRTSFSPDGVYPIQPINATTSFLVWCYFVANGITSVLQRHSTFTFPAFNWSAAKSWVGDDTTPTQNYFIGLHNLHLLTSQATYHFIVKMLYDEPAGATFAHRDYASLNVGSEGTSYELHYVPLEWNGQAGNGFSTVPPLLFSTADNDSNACVESRKHAGWFGADCSGFSPFATPMTWPVNAVKILDYLEFSLMKNSSYVEN